MCALGALAAKVTVSLAGWCRVFVGCCRVLQGVAGCCRVLTLLLRALGGLAAEARARSAAS